MKSILFSYKMSSKEIFERLLAPTSTNPVALEIDYAKGTILFDKSGKQYYDLIAGIGVTSLGHQHPAVIRAVETQMRKHAHVMVYGEYIQDSVSELAAELTSLLPQKLGCVYFVNSGTEANEAAMKLAKRITGRHEIIAFKKGYHGNTQGSMSVSGNEAKKRRFRPLLPGVRFIEFNNPADISKISTKTAAVIMEPIQGDAGVVIPDHSFMTALRAKCSETGTQLIFDEVQTGIGRTGKLFAFEHFGIEPDILTLAKGLGGGLPIGAFLSSYENMQLWAEYPMLGHITTFGGNPVSCAAAQAVLSTLKKESIIQNVDQKGALFEKLLHHRAVKEIRRKGLMIAIELEDEAKVDKAITLAREAGVIIYWFLSTRNAFRISPPLTISEPEIRDACARLTAVFDKL